MTFEGTWKFDEDSEVRAYSDGGDLIYNVAMVYSDEFGHLIAAAPDMFEALEQLLGKALGDERIGWLGHSASHPDLFQCEFCKAEHLDCTEIEHGSGCPMPLARTALARARGDLS